ncbi:MAG: AmmeMemoRadiSam system protein B [Desulfobulbaceae bacterium]|nr:AmmeMemoRadiSam system protein B [Desulfobulbaceae bacterium]
MISTCETVLALLSFFVFTAVDHGRRGEGDRRPAVSGTFYPDRADDLRQTLRALFSGAVGRRGLLDVRALIVPHAGYVYSGEVAASGFAQLEEDMQYDNIFVLGPSHQVGFEGAAVFCTGNFMTPLGSVEVNCTLAEKLVADSPLFVARNDAHAREHSIEVQLPFLQYHLKKPFRIVPIVLGVNSPVLCCRIGEMLRPFFNEKNLFVISTDFSHYPAYEAARTVDTAVAEAIISNSPERLFKTMQRYETSGIPGLATTLCGVSGVLTLMAMTSADGAFRYHPIQYRNSGDMPMGDKSRVVGYHAIVVNEQGKGQERKDNFQLTDKAKELLLGIARRAISHYLKTRCLPEIREDLLSEEVRLPCGAFVTLEKNGQLRGCIGQFESVLPLYALVQEMAIAAALRDSRFTPVQEGELEELTVEISVLTPMRKINSIAEFELGRHGIYIRQGQRSGTFLPQVARDTGWTAEEFFGHCARDKAGIGWDGWKDAELYVYEALVFGER